MKSISPYVFPGIKEQYRPSINRKFKKSSITPEEILKIISDHCGVTTDEVLSRTRKKEKVEARHIFCAIMKIQFGYSYTSIGEMMGHRDHTTAIHSVKTFHDRFKIEDGYKELISNILYSIDVNMK